MTLLERVKIHQRAWDAPRGVEICLKAFWNALLSLELLPDRTGESPKLAFLAYLNLVENLHTGRLDKSTLAHDAERLASRLGISLPKT